MNKQEIQESEDNNIILSQVLADEVRAARSKRYPSAEEILNEMKGGKL